MWWFSRSSSTGRVCPTFFHKLRLLRTLPKTHFPLTRNLPTKTTGKDESVGKTGRLRPTSPGRSVHVLCARDGNAFIETPTSWPHITAPQDGSDGYRKVCLGSTATMTVYVSIGILSCLNLVSR